MIKEVKKYIDDDARVVTAYIPLEAGKSEVLQEELAAYEGQVRVSTPMGMAHIVFPFPFNYTLEQCYENFEDIATAETNRIMEEEEKRVQEAEEKAKEDNLILTPEQMRAQGQGPIPFPR